MYHSRFLFSFISSLAQNLRTPVMNLYNFCLNIPITNDNIHFTWLCNRVKTFIKWHYEKVREINILLEQFLEIGRKTMVNNISRFSSSKWKLFCSGIIRKSSTEAIRNVIVWILREPKDNSCQRPYNVSFHSLSIVSKRFNSLLWWCGCWGIESLFKWGHFRGQSLPKKSCNLFQLD